MTAVSARRAGRHLVLVGPTAGGKSATAVALARRRIAAGHPVEIVSCDSMAVYRGMDVGTATPSLDARGGVPHHLLDVVDPGEEFSVHRFVELVDEALDRIESRGADAVLVGGTGLYVRALTDGLDLPDRCHEGARALPDLDTDGLRRPLEELDPLASSRVPPGIRRRLLRALEVTVGSGRPFSPSGPGLGEFPPTPYVLAGLHVDREALAARIRERFDRQLADGFLDEARALVARPGGLSRTAAGALGYRELWAHLRGEVDLDEAVELAVTRTRRFAVRQERWFRRDPRLRWFECDGAVAAIDRHWAECAGAATGSTTTVDGGASAVPPP